MLDDITFSGGLGFGLPHGLAQTSSTLISTEGENTGFHLLDKFTTAQTFDGKKIYLRRKARNRDKNWGVSLSYAFPGPLT